MSMSLALTVSKNISKAMASSWYDPCRHGRHHVTHLQPFFVAPCCNPSTVEDNSPKAFASISSLLKMATIKASLKINQSGPCLSNLPALHAHAEFLELVAHFCSFLKCSPFGLQKEKIHSILNELYFMLLITAC